MPNCWFVTCYKIDMGDICGLIMGIYQTLLHKSYNN